MSPAVASVSKPIWKTVAASASDASSAGRLTVGTQIRSHSRSIAARPLTVLAQEGGERLRVERRVGEVGPAQRGECPPESQTVGEGEVVVADEAAGEVERGGKTVAAQPRDFCAGSEDRELQAVLQAHRAGGADAVEERAVRGAAAQEDVLAVVEPQAPPPERPGGTTEAAAALEERHGCALVGEREGRAQPGEAAAHHDDAVAAHGEPTVIALAATSSLVRVGSDTRRSSTTVGSRSMRSSRRR